MKHLTKQTEKQEGMMKLSTIKHHLSHFEHIILKSKDLPTLRLKRGYASEIIACNEEEFQETEGLPHWFEITVKEILKYEDWEVV